MKILTFLFATLLFISCRTVKNIDTVKVVKDSSAIRAVDSLIEVKRTDSANYNAMIAALSENQIVFRDTGSTVTKIEYYPDGSVKSVQGQVKTLNTKLSKSEQVSAYWKQQYDSLASHQDTAAVQVKTEFKEVTKKVKRTVFPWYFWLLLLVAAAGGFILKKRNII